MPVCPHAGGVGLCELVQHLSMFDYVAVSGSLDDRVIEYVDHLHEHFLDPVVIDRGAYRVPRGPASRRRCDRRRFGGTRSRTARHGVDAHVDLATGATREGAAPVADDGWGGPIAALRILAEGLDDPLPPVVLVAGAVGGVAAPGLARMAAVGVSPLSGGSPRPAPKARSRPVCGAPASPVWPCTARAAAPVVVVVRDGAVTLAPAAALIGLETGPATDALLDMYGADAAVAVIGPAGEHLVPYANVVTCRAPPAAPTRIRRRSSASAASRRSSASAPPCRRSRSPLSLARIAFRYGAAIPGNPLTAWQKADPGFGIWRGAPGYAMVANFADTATSSGDGAGGCSGTGDGRRHAPAARPTASRCSAVPACTRRPWRCSATWT